MRRERMTFRGDLARLVPLVTELPSAGNRSPAWRSSRAIAAHHVVKHAQGNSDFDLDRLVALCPPCHGQTDAPYARGRLVVTPLGDGRFTVEVTRAADKWAIRA
jgi:5-methylcytosine-specific restriction endonuclease McrA